MYISMENIRGSTEIFQTGKFFVVSVESLVIKLNPGYCTDAVVQLTVNITL